MRMTDIPLDWLVPGALLLVGVFAAAALVVRGKRAAARSAGEDSWERSEERRRRKETIFASASYLLLFCCAAVAAALSFHGLVGFGTQNLNLSGGWEYLVPFGLDGAAMFCSVLAVREASHGDAALGSRMLVWTFAGAAAWFNWVHAPRGLDHAGAPQFFAGMSLSAAVLFDRALKQTRRAALREQGLVPRPLPQIRIVRWLRAPRETFAAWSLMLLEGVRTLDEAVEEVREDRREKEQNRHRRREQGKLDRARIKAINRQHRAWGIGRGGGRQLAVTQAAAAPAEVAGPDPAIAGDSPPMLTGESPVRSRPALKAVAGAEAEGAGALAGPPRTVDLTAEDDTQTIPRLDSLEEKLAEIERQFG
ncbi:DUF2637 domain-containing protein [Streptomyces sp. Je 1-4]|uniref:DUF2637 domain-containing protein n=1 Tax=Streptomyces TaxID=1883 RepID=UPI00140EB7D4|nr:MULTISPECIES: DUF2637 domain-containing protein [unclassified Streptomyces]QIK05917.1 DUF2637 domain-containing protein [Streptomyces sp. ID38640]UYB39239.1 DUF2637 domain-containing protein [Streptomyces sp. Je 1-4]UZQ35257.1 DUF2637 domain-containing protein [Streptomyces sp. Je 1-4] [Streptomyces sp. Je 1-4 4N24]UZQ42675.1 DUF2637 domain-containing protein [Streptomyces sp. Je 1-4] [Streptomyces sp. Je 1-4 4N24_ara]